MKNEIIIGKEFEAQFNSLKTLIPFLAKNGLLKGELAGVYYDSSTDVIDTLSTSFRFDSSISSVSYDEAKIGPDGANWFSNLRNKEESTANYIARWRDLIEQVSNVYHKNYALFEFDQKDNRLNQATEYNNIIKNVMINLFKGNYSSEMLNGENATSDIYALSIRMEVTGGSGEAIPIIGSIYLKKNQFGSFNPISSNDAKLIDESFKNADLSQAKKIDNSDSSQIIRESSSALESLIRENKHDKKGLSFEDCLLYASKEDDEENIKKLVERGAEQDVTLTVNNLKILSISHFKWIDAIYIIKYIGKSVLSFTFGLNNSITVKCLGCGETLISNNQIVYNGLNIDPTKSDLCPESHNNKDFEKDLFKVATKFNSEHLINKRCEYYFLNGMCERFVCKTNLIVDNDYSVCKNCPYPEMIQNVDGERVLTKNLIFAKDRLNLIKYVKEDGNPSTFICPCCGQTYSLSYKENDMNVCKDCSFIFELNLIQEEEKKKYKKLYRKYHKCLPLGVRFLNLFNKKYCFEKDNLVWFKLKNTIYTLDVLNVNNHGYIVKPRKYKI